MTTSRNRSLAVLIVALVLAVVGTSVASATAVPTAAKITKKTIKKIANKQIAKAAPTLTVASATNATNATNADRLDGLDANQLVRATTVTSATTIDDFSTGTFTSVLSRSVTAPTAGIFVISGQVNTARDVGGGAQAVILLRGSVNGAAATAETAVTDATTHSLIYGTPAHVSGAFPVPAGTHTVAIQARMVSGWGYLTSRSLTVTFVPFGDTGAQGTVGRPATVGKPRSLQQ